MIRLCTYCLPLGPAFRRDEDTQRKGRRQRSSGTTEFHVTLFYNISTQNVSPAGVQKATTNSSEQTQARSCSEKVNNFGLFIFGRF